MLLPQENGAAREKCRVDRLPVTCDDDNVASIRTIEKNGGILENIAGPDLYKPVRRYWIDLRNSEAASACSRRATSSVR